MNGISSRRAALVLSLLVFGCRSGSKETDAKEIEAQATRAADQTYQVRGVLVSIDAERAKVNVQHEAIPDFKDGSGKVVGMSAMTMPFHVASGVDLASFTAGDKVAFTLEVRWETKRELLIPQMNKLAADTELQVK
jgi:Cu/Ag efflux protein CusF